MFYVFLYFPCCLVGEFTLPISSIRLIFMFFLCVFVFSPSVLIIMLLLVFLCMFFMCFCVFSLSFDSNFAACVFRVFVFSVFCSLFCRLCVLCVFVSCAETGIAEEFFLVQF